MVLIAGRTKVIYILLYWSLEIGSMDFMTGVPDFPFKLPVCCSILSRTSDRSNKHNFDAIPFATHCPMWFALLDPK